MFVTIRVAIQYQVIAEDKAISAAIEEGVGACLRLSPAAGAALRVRQLHWVCATAGADAGRALYRRLIRDGDAAASGAAAAAFVRSCIALEASTCATEGRRPAETVEPIRWLFEVASRLEGQPSHLSPCAQADAADLCAVGFSEARHDAELWLEWIRYEEAWGEWCATSSHISTAPSALGHL